MIDRRTVVCLGLSQLICWGITYYLIAVFGEAIAADLGWRRETVYGGLSAAILVMGLVSPPAGRLIDRYGGRIVMAVGSLLIAAACALLAQVQDLAGYYGAWLCLGVAMRLTLYDAAFAALARIGGRGARQPIARITLLGGLATSLFWPFGALLLEHTGWRDALLVYAACALLTLPLHLALPRHRKSVRAGSPPKPKTVPAPLARDGGSALAAGLFAVMAAAISMLSSGLAAHMIGLLTALGIAAPAAVWIAALRGGGQTAARLGEVLFARQLDPLTLNLGALLALPLALLAGFFSAQLLAAAVVFSFLYGAGNGLATITRGTLPLVLFEPRLYGISSQPTRVP